MARFEVYLNPDGNGFLVDVQADLMSHLNSRLVIPLVRSNIAPTPIKVLNPIFQIEEATYLMLTQQMAAVSVQMLKRPVLNVNDRRDEVVAAIDLLLQGY
ncbi:MAG: CcdB family protein [Steroidobacteraceae bacterium]